MNMIISKEDLKIQKMTNGTFDVHLIEYPFSCLKSNLNSREQAQEFINEIEIN